MKNILYRLLLLPLLLAAWGAQAQAPAWLNAYGVPTTSSVFGTATNTAGDVFVTGNFSGSATFGGTTLTSAGEDDIFVAKWNSTSNSWAWAVRGGGSAADQGNGIAVNGTNVYVTGYFNSNGGATFGNFATTFNGSGGQEIFVAKFVDGGTSVTTTSVVSAGGGSSDQGRAIAVSGSNVYITGYVTGAASFGGAALTPVYTTFDAYVAKYVDSGTLTYNSALRAGGSNIDRGNSIAVNGTNIYVAGDFRSLTAAFGSTTITNSNTDSNNLSYDGFVAKFTDSGTLAHATAVKVGGNSANAGNSPLDFANDIAVSGTNIYLTGAFFSSSISFGNGVTLTNSDNTGANSDMYLAKYTDSGTLTAVAATKSNNSSADVGSSVAVTGSTVYVAGNLLGSAVYGSSTLTSSGGQDVFVAKFTDAGSSFTPVGAISGGGTGDENANGLAINGTQVIVGGFLNPAQSATFVTNSGTTTIPAGNGGFIARVGVVVTLPTVTTTAASLIASTSATLGGNVTADGGGTVTDRGVVYSTTNTTPAIGGTGVTQNANGTGTGTFSETNTGLTASTTYYVRAYAINSAGTSYGAVISFTTAAPVSGTTVVTNVSCFGGSNGTINLTPTGGLGPYTYAWNNGTTTEDRTGLSAGTYSVVITDAAGATGAVNNIVVGQPTSALSAGSTSQTTIACNGGATGAASISPIGGTSPYTYRWSTGATTQTITGLRAGTYSVTVTDANGCTISRSFNITEPSALTATTSQTDVTTNGGSNGSATITVSGGVPSYTYSWSPNVSTTATASNLRAGSYTVTATDANGCTITRSFTIAEPTVVTVVSVTRLNPSPTATTSVSYRVVFSGSVTGLSSSNFTVTTSGAITGTAVGTVSGSGTTYTVPVNTGTSDGTLRLNVANSTGITPTVSGLPYTTGELYTITKSFAANPQLTIVGTGGTGSDVTAFVDAVQVLSGGTTVANALQNGSFETHDPLANGDFGYQPTGAGWAFNNSSGIAESGSAFTPITPIPNGIAVAFVQSNSGSNGQLQQGLTVPTGSYQVNFQAAQRICCTTLDQSLNVFINGVFVGTIQPGSNGYTAFTSATFNVTAPALTATISSTAGASGSTTATSPIPFTVAFSQSATGFTASDVVVAGGTVSGFTGSGTTYTFNVTPSASGTVTVNVPANSAFDGNNTGNTAATQYSLIYAQPVTAAPVVIAPVNGGTQNTTTPTYVGTAPAGATIRVYVDGTLIASTTTANSAGNWAITQPTSLAQGSHTVYATAQSNGSSVSANSSTNTFIVDSVRPTVAISSSAGTTGSTTSTTPIPYTVTFSEAVTGFVAGDVTVSNGTLSGFSGSGTTYAFNVTPTTAGTATTVNIPANVAQDQAGNGNTAATQLSITYVGPTITVAPATLSNGTVGTAYSQTVTASGGTAPYTFAITSGALPAGLTLTAGGTVSGTPTAGGSTFNFTVTATDAARFTGSRPYTLVIGSPTITVAPTSLPAGTVAAAYSQTITASGGTAPYIFTIITGALPSGLTLTTGGVLAGTPTASGTFSFRVAATDASTGAGAPFTGSLAYSLVIASQPVTAAPVITSPANNSFTNQDVAISGTAPAGSAVTVYVSQNGTAYQEIGTFTATGGTFSTGPLGLPSATFQTYAIAQSPGAAESANSATITFTVDQTAPTVAITSTAGINGSTTTTTPIPYTVTFSEAVTGFVAGDVTVSNGTLSGFSGSGTTYAFNVTPTTAGTATTVSIPANVAQDQAGNGNTAATQLSITYQPTLTSWTGLVSTDWYTDANWTAGAPAATTDAIIPTSPSGGRFPAISIRGNQAQARNLVLNSGATLTHTTGLLTLTANLTNNGTYTAPAPNNNVNDPSVSLGTTQRANILGSGNTRFCNLTIGANGAQSSTAASTSVQGLFTLNGNFATNGNPLTLESNATATAMVVNNGASVLSGTVTVQRYIVPDLNPGLGYRHVSTPISNATVASLTTGSFTPVVNPAYNTSATPTSERPFPTVYGYDQSRLATTTNNLPAFDKGWFSPAALSDAMTVGQGYTVNIGAGQTWNFVGAVNNGNVSQTLTRNAGATTDDSGLQLVGNPYPSPLDWQKVASADHPGVDDVIYVWQSNTPGNPYAGNYGFYQNNIGNINPVLSLGQAFFVRVKAGQTSGTLNLKNSHRSTSYTNPTYHRTAAETRPVVQLTLKGAGSVVTDDAFVYFQEGATNGFDSSFDAEKLVNPSGLNLSTSLSAKQRLSIDGRGLLGTAQQVVPLAVGVPAVGSYSLSTAQLLNLDATPVYLRDLQLGTVTDLRTTPSYQFTVTNASALITGRFELVFSPQQALATVPAALAQQVALYPNPAKKAAFVELPASLGRQAVTASLVDALGRQVRTVSLPAQGALAHQLDLSELATGVYALRLSTSAGVVVKKLVIE
jgi:hypothetical protein